MFTHYIIVVMSRLDQLKALLSESPGDDFILFAIAKEHQKHDELSLAREAYEGLKEKNPEYVGLYYHLGKVLEDLELPDEAMKIYNEGITVAKKLSDFHALKELMNVRTNLEMEL